MTAGLGWGGSGAVWGWRGGGMEVGGCGSGGVDNNDHGPCSAGSPSSPAGSVPASSPPPASANTRRRFSHTPPGGAARRPATRSTFSSTLPLFKGLIMQHFILNEFNIAKVTSRIDANKQSFGIPDGGTQLQGVHPTCLYVRLLVLRRSRRSRLLASRVHFGSLETRPQSD